jgi:hypothetical protein
MNFCDAMELLKSGKKVTRMDWKDDLYFVMEQGKVLSYQPVIEQYQYTEDIMVSEGWIVEDEEDEKLFCEIIPYLQQIKKAWMKTWDTNFYIYLDPEYGLILHKMCVFSFHPCFEDFKSEDWIEL